MARARIGDMLDQIVIQQRSATQDAYGEEVESWATYATVWANIATDRRASDLERFVQGAGKERQRTQYVARIYYDTTVTVDAHRVSWNSKVYDIEQVIDPDGRRQWTELKLRESN